jgi:pSer/pThr/pTyr-binding forkhead associated (FHA) protein
MSTYRLKGASGAVINQAFPLGEKTLIGSADDCDLRIQNEGIEPRHAEITQEQEALVLNNLATAAETLLNGEAVDRASLASGDEIRIGNCRWVLQAPGLRPEKVLTSDVIRPRRSYLPWLIVGALLAAAALSWQRGWLPF